MTKPNHNVSVMVNDGAEMLNQGRERVSGSSALCHSSAASSQEEEQLIANDKPGISRSSTSYKRYEDETLLRMKLKGFYCITAVFVLYTVVYFTYLLMRKR